MRISILQYVTAAGRNPYQTWLNGLQDKVAKAHVIRRILRIEIADFGDYKRLVNGVSELRIDVGPGYRVYFAATGNMQIVLLCAGNKSTQERDIARAKRYLKDYRDRHGQA
jgi:putative addiction module killer protein